MIILGIETSCDDTGIAIVEADERRSKRGLTRIPAPEQVRYGVNFNIRSNIVSSQIKTHAPFGGVVPNLAAREHLKNIEPCLKKAFQETNLKPSNIDLIAVTIGPGLIPSLLIGVNFANALAYVWKKPIVAINHIEAHILASIYNLQVSIFNKFSNDSIFKHLFPAIALVVSGGHTQLVLVKKIGDYKILGETRDDAAGECFDKIAKLLGLGYPGGPEIAKKASDYKLRITDYKLHLPRPMINQKNFDFSFSGLKTAMLYLLKDIKQKYPIFYDRRKKGIDIVPELCREVQQAIIDVLISKTLRAAQEYKAKTIILSGGVAANEELRKQFAKKIRVTDYGLRVTNFLVPPKNLCTDNGAMIAMAGYFNRKKTCPAVAKQLCGIKADANLRLS